MNTRTNWITRTETDADIPAVRAIVLAAFDTPMEAGLVDALRADTSWIPGLSVVTLTPDGTVVGHALLTRCHIGDAPALCLAPVAVLPEYQKTGAGSAAVRAALDAAEGMGEHAVTVLGHPDYYPRFGFTRASVYGIRPPFDVPDEAMMALGLDAGRSMPGGTIRYATPFGV
ncbi:GNAT family N-acetyltransferase [Streptomyces albireticuli]|uniref:GNAT family N-acetyltransferase n=1 Tax=Streptomyces albireticuli TaxID=1940 RepID=A0A2A2D986_9ACTN|nr:N-acetyltransferase [Streptomyces albireticuli]MCD9141259.1 N-acetyltransferase [Streptomyces albireticuli]MCD9160780.1 N-acetyltransferase [Streptomyces albireticuli]MCD9191163.1 N-acetyltransferase [Streptomyces albireticuli]PAU49053.1 GNAT family N-acetyltransferase [Streptomyces albireticuli]